MRTIGRTEMIIARVAIAGLVLQILATVAGAVEISGELLRDKIRGGMLGQIIGNLNGLPHEMKYIDEPGNVSEYTPALPDGARTDDDTDMEWVYICTMQKENEIYLRPERIAALWKERINRGLWCSNRFARNMMEFGFEPPLTGSLALNPWAEFNISGQFLCETFALLAPAMPQTASRIGLNYTRVAIDGEPAQSTQLFCTMIAMAFVENDVNRIIANGVDALDEKSVIRQIVADVREWHGKYQDNWRQTRRLIKEKYVRHGGQMRDNNGYEVNTAAVIAALLYGNGDFVQTMKMAFNIGWDADCVAATCGTIVGVTKGYKWMMSQGWQIVDRYKNTTRDNMPKDETITGYADRVIDLAELVITRHGGRRILVGGRVIYEIPAEKNANVHALVGRDAEVGKLRERMGTQVKETVAQGQDRRELARTAYVAICLDMSEQLHKDNPQRWTEAINSLAGEHRFVQNIYYDSNIPASLELRKKASAAGLEKPPTKNIE